MLSKVYNCGIRGDLFGWISNFLSNRIQRVVVNGKFSEWNKVTSGIPQGSVLGPLLFTIFINNIPANIDSCIKIFADDTKIYNSVSNSNVLSLDLLTLVQWSEKWLLPFNVDKCKVIHYGRQDDVTVYYMDGRVVSEDTHIKDLGVNFQNNLKFDEHICNICATANSRLGIIRNTFHRIELDGFIILFKALVRPLLEYCNIIWTPHLKMHNKMIEQIQRRATRMIRGMKELSYTERLRILNLTTLYYRRRRQDVIQVFRIINNIDSNIFEDFFELDLGSTRGNNRKLIKPRASTSVKLNSFSHRVVNDWNSLPNTVVLSTSLNCFKSNLNKFWSDIPFKFDFVF